MFEVQTELMAILGRSGTRVTLQNLREEFIYSLFQGLLELEGL